MKQDYVYFYSSLINKRDTILVDVYSYTTFLLLYFIVPFRKLPIYCLYTYTKVISWRSRICMDTSPLNTRPFPDQGSTNKLCLISIKGAVRRRFITYLRGYIKTASYKISWTPTFLSFLVMYENISFIYSWSYPLKGWWQTLI